MSILDILEAGNATQPEVKETSEMIATVDYIEVTTPKNINTTSKKPTPKKAKSATPKKEKATPKKPVSKKGKTKVSKEVAAPFEPKEVDSALLESKQPDITSLLTKEIDGSISAPKKASLPSTKENELSPLAFCITDVSPISKELATTPHAPEKIDATPFVSQEPTANSLAAKEAESKPYKPSFLDTFALEELIVVDNKSGDSVTKDNPSELASSKANSSIGKKRELPFSKSDSDTKTEGSDAPPKEKKSRGRPKGSVSKSKEEKKVVLEIDEKQAVEGLAGSDIEIKEDSKPLETDKKQAVEGSAGSDIEDKEDSKPLETGKKRRGRPRGSLKPVKEKIKPVLENGVKKSRGRPKGSRKLLSEVETHIKKKTSKLNKYKKHFDDVVYEPQRDKNRCLAGRLRSSFLPIKQLELSSESMINFSEWAFRYFECLKKKQLGFDDDVKSFIETETIKYAKNDISLWDSDLISLDKTLFGNGTESKLDFSSGLSKMELRLIIDWKFLREKKVTAIFKLLNSNSDMAIRKAIKIVYNSLQEKLVLNQGKGPAQFLADYKSDIGSWMIHLTGLNGITVPTASAILSTMTDHIPYMSHEGLSASLGQACNRIALDAYNSYIDYVYSVIKKSDSVNLTPRSVERAWYAKAVLSNVSE